MAVSNVASTDFVGGSLLGRYRVRLERAKNFREKEGYDELWERLIDLYAGKHFPNALTTEDRIVVNVAFSTVNVIGPSIAVNHPKIVVWARKLEDDARGAIAEAVVNYWWRHFKISEQFKLCVKDFLIVGHGWMKVGWRYVEVEREATSDELDADYDEAKADAESYAQQHPELAHQLPTDDEIAASLPDTKLDVKEDRPFVERVSPFDMFIDPEATCMDDAKWIAQRIVKTVEEVKNDPRYDEKVRAKVKPDAQVKSSWLAIAERDKPDQDCQRVTVWEFYNIPDDTMCVFADSAGKMDGFLVKPKPIPYDFGHPFLMLRNYDVPDHFYPMGDLEAIESLNLELDKTRSQMMNHRRKYQRKYLYDPDAFDQQAMGDLMADEDNVLVAVRSNNKPLGEVVVPMAQTPTPPEFYQQSQLIEQDIDLVSGVSEYQRGAMPEIRRTATEANMMKSATDARVADKLAQIEMMIGRIGERLVQLAQQYVTDQQTARIMDGWGQPMWVDFKRDDIVGEFDFEVEGGSTQPKNDTERKQEAREMLQTFGPFMAWGLIQPMVLVSYALKHGWDVRNPAQFLTPTAQDAHYHPMLREEIRETINYKDAPPDIQRQMEMIAGYQPSQQPQTQPDQAKLVLAQQKASAQSPTVQAAHQAILSSQDAQHQALLAAQQHQQQQAQAQQQGQQQQQANNQTALNQMLLEHMKASLAGAQQAQQQGTGQTDGIGPLGAVSPNGPIPVGQAGPKPAFSGGQGGTLPLELLSAFMSMANGKY